VKYQVFAHDRGIMDKSLAVFLSFCRKIQHFDKLSYI